MVRGPGNDDRHSGGRGRTGDRGGRLHSSLLNTTTVPANGDENPYGVAFVPEGFPGGGQIKAGDVLVSNFNDSANIQGTGTTIVSFIPDGTIAPPGTANRVTAELLAAEALGARTVRYCGA